MKKRNKEEFQERRIFERTSSKISIRFLDLHTHKWISVKTQNISVRGIGLITDKDLSPHTPLELQLPLPNRVEPYCTKGEVIWSSKIAPNRYKVGVCLERLDLAGMCHFVKPVKKRPEHDRTKKIHQDPGRFAD